ncbi:DUF2971 domain-containing protein [Herbaspirillum rubrisubalbicans]|uniref:DUF2971 domain-containing protein n=1 Tax=Herbaspirillum rubrisubalbicans TaxID=80842 RepID=UPI000375F19F|nr:DUF2971 domain-containing protein [Herbaspirillum rubrisubalbicans]
MLEKKTIAFSQVKTFNDPTEVTAAGYNGEMTDGFPRDFLLNQAYGVCCLTRTALNPIMWAHYADCHRGLVIGIDSQLAELESLDECILPARYGAVIYTASKPNHPYELSEEQAVREGKLTKFDHRYLEALQRMFLQKSSEWAYEEEVRIVKTIENLRNQSIFLPNGPNAEGFRELWGTYLLTIPPQSIRSVHLGWHTSPMDFDGAKALFLALEQWAPGIDVYECSFERYSWKMQAKKIIDWRALLNGRFFD